MIVGGGNMNRIRNKELLLVVLFVIGTILGTIAVLVFQSILGIEMKIYRPEIRTQIQAITDSWGLFFYILQSRFWELTACILLSMTVIAYPVFGVLCSYSGFCMACMIVTATMTYGIRGIPAFLAVVLPHYLFYGGGVGLLMLQSCQRQQLPFRYAVQSYLIIACIFLLGVLSEAWCNPWLLQRIL